MPSATRTTKSCRKHNIAMLLPQARRTKTDVTILWQTALVYPEAFQLPPVEYRLDKITFRYGNVRGTFTAENAQYESARSPDRPRLGER